METDGLNRRLGYQAWEWIERTKGALTAKKLGAGLSNYFMVENPGQDYVTILPLLQQSHPCVQGLGSSQLAAIQLYQGKREKRSRKFTLIVGMGAGEGAPLLPRL